MSGTAFEFQIYSVSCTARVRATVTLTGFARE